MPLDHSIVDRIRAPRLADLTDAYAQGIERTRKGRLADLQAGQMATEAANAIEDRTFLKEDRTTAKAAVAKKTKTEEEDRHAKIGKEILGQAIPWMRAIPDPAQRATMLRESMKRRGVDDSEIPDMLDDATLDGLEQGLIAPETRATLKATAAKTAADQTNKAADDKARADALAETKRHNIQTEKSAWASATKPPAGQVEPGSVAIPGFTPQAGVQITKDSVRNLKGGAQAYDTIKEQIGRLRDIYAGKVDPKTGARTGGTGTEMGGEKARQMASIMRQIQFTLKGPEFVNLGVLNGPDLALLDEMVANPTGFWNNAKAMVPGLGDPVEPSLKELENFIEGRFNSAIERNGFRRAASTPPTAAAVKVGTKAERDKLPPGTRYVGPDGKEYVKK